jgi:hypothetical protein
MRPRSAQRRRERGEETDVADNFPRGKAAIVGAATFGIGEAPGMKPNDMAAMAVLDALKSARMSLKDVDALFVCT